MNLRPVIERELRVAARQRATYLSRLWPGLVFTIITSTYLLAATSSWSPLQQQGQFLFAMLNVVLYCLVWLIVPLATADCLSREKREDTLGLLLLTPLRPFDLVLAKLFGGLWQSAMLVLTIVPMLAIPMLMGGVTPLDLARAVLSLATALISAVTVGLLASSLCERRGRAWLVVLMLGALWLYLLLGMHGLLLAIEHLIRNPNFRALNTVFDGDFFFILPAVGWMMQSGIGAIAEPGTLGATLGRVMMSGLILLLTVLASFWALVIASRRLARFAETRFLTARQERTHALFTRERFALGQLRRSRKRLLDRNPVVWMQHRRWSHRLVKWGWLLVASGVISVATLDQGWRFAETPVVTALWLGLFVLFSLLLVTSANLQAERDSGALELLLVTPLTPTSFAHGRVQGFWSAFLPAAAVIVVPFWLYAFVSLQMTWHRGEVNFWFLAPLIAATMFFGLLLWWMPAIGLCFSLNRPGLLAAALNTFFFAVAIPWGLPLALFLCGALPHRLLEEPPEFRPVPIWGLVAVWVALTAGFQIAVWRSALRRQTPPFPQLMPAWSRRLRLAWLGPWLVPLLCFAFLSVFPMDYLKSLPRSEEWLFSLWNLSAWLTLWFLGRRCRRALIAMLEQRQFGQRATAD